MIKKLSVCFAFLFSIPTILIAQKSSTSNDYYNFRNFGSSKPTIELSYGLSDINLEGINFNLADAGLFELKLGFTSQGVTSYGTNILKYKNRFLFLSNASSSNYTKSINPGVANNMWRFGLGNKEGYGVKLGSVSISTYNSNSFAWTEFEYTQPPMPANLENDQPDYSALNDFNDAFRFGSTTEGGINIQLSKGFSIQPKYEIADIFPRHLFGKQFMSSVIEYSGLFLVDTFTREIMRNAPVAGTFVNFILKNAYEYGFYQLRKTEMNWPFTSAAPLRYNTFKLGMTFTF